MRRGRTAAAAMGCMLSFAACTSAAPPAALSPSTAAAPLPSAAPSVESSVATTDPPPSVERGDGEWLVDATACPRPELVDTPLPATVRVGLLIESAATAEAAAADPVAIGLRLALDDANRRLAVTGHAFELVTVEGGASGSSSVSNVERLIAQGVHVFAGNVRSVGETAMAFAVSAACVPSIADNGDADPLSDLTRYGWVTSQSIPAGTEGAIVGTAVADQGGLDGEVAMIATDDARGAAFAGAMRAVLATKSIAAQAPVAVKPDDLSAAVRAVRRVAGQEPPVVALDVTAYQCPAMLRELASLRSSGTSWAPTVMVSSRCGRRALLGLAGRAADGVLTVGSFADVAAPDRSGAAAEFGQALDAMGIRGERGGAVLGWSSGEALVNACVEASVYGPLTRRTVIEAARQMQYAPELVLDGIESRTMGAADVFPIESMQVLRWTNRRFETVGPPVTEFERTA